MEISVNFVVFEELQESAGRNGAEARIVVLCQNKDSNLLLEDGAVTFFPLD